MGLVYGMLNSNFASLFDMHRVRVMTKTYSQDKSVMLTQTEGCRKNNAMVSVAPRTRLRLVAAQQFIIIIFFFAMNTKFTFMTPTCAVFIGPLPFIVAITTPTFR